MRKIVTMWCHNRQYFLDEICLLEAAKWHYKLGVGPVDVLVLKGYDIASEFTDELKGNGYTLHDASQIFSKLSQRFERLGKIYPEFLFMNFLRWLAIEAFFSPNSCACFDADLVLTSRICDDPVVQSSTFTSTSTAFVVINDPNWFRAYRELLETFNDDPHLFENIWNKDVDSNILQLSDAFKINEETFVRFLVKTGRVYNKFPECSYIIAPFIITLCNSILPYNNLSLPISYERRPGVGDFLNNQPLAYLHFQNHFKNLLGFHLLYKYVFDNIHPARLEPAFRLDNKTASRPDIILLQKSLKEMTIKGIFGVQHTDMFTRRRVMQEFLFDNDFSSVFNEYSWHFPSVFKASPIV